MEFDSPPFLILSPPLLLIIRRSFLPNLSPQFFQQALEDYYVVIPHKLSQAQRDFFDTPLTLDDFKSALSHMANDKSLGIDGFPYEFYKIF